VTDQHAAVVAEPNPRRPLPQAPAFSVRADGRENFLTNLTETFFTKLTEVFKMDHAQDALLESDQAL
jgi:hypothetical protein